MSYDQIYIKKQTEITTLYINMHDYNSGTEPICLKL